MKDMKELSNLTTINYLNKKKKRAHKRGHCQTAEISIVKLK